MMNLRLHNLHRHRVVRELLSLSMIVLLMLAARSSLADHYVVPTGSMEHTILPGDRVLVDKRAYGLRIPFTTVRIAGRESSVKRGDIVVFDSPRDGTRLIKRIVAVGGDRVTLVDGHLQINGKSLQWQGDSERFGERTAQLNLQHGGGSDIRNLDIPQGVLLAIGDHRGNSADSRVFGFVEEAEVYGKAVGIYYRRNEGPVWQPL
jgi:signal peptidase I